MRGEIKKTDWFVPAAVAFLAILAAAYLLPALLPKPFLPAKDYPGAPVVALPPPAPSNASFESALLARRSVRDYTNESISPGELSALLFAAQGISDGKRTAPSAGGLYPLELYVLVSRVEGIAPGAYHYNNRNNSLELVAAGDYREKIASVAAGQPWVGNAAVVIVFAAIKERTTSKYGARGVEYVWLEAGHASENLLLQAAALGLGAAPIGAFNEGEGGRLLNLSDGEEVIYLNIVGRPA
ncbi:MAG: SagB/ThcOx family dehydrogenase [Candidatus Micrarchaeia archaeon]